MSAAFQPIPPRGRFRRALIAGGDGFIGIHLVKRMEQADVDVIVVDDHSTSRPDPTVDRHVITMDVCRLDISDVPPVDAVVHLASPAAPHLFARDPGAVIGPNTVGTARLLELARRDGCRLLFASSSEVYGRGQHGEAFREDHVVTHRLLTGRSAYGAAKRLGEELVATARMTNVDAASVRMFNVYGPRMDPTMGSYARVIPNFLRAARQRRPLPIEGDGRQVRSFTWIEDVVDGLLRLLLCPDVLPLAVNLGHDEPVAIGDLADLVERLVGEASGRERRDRAPDDADWRRPDLALLERTIGWKPTTSLRDGLARLLEVECP